MTIRPSEPGAYVSGIAHIAVLAMALVVFSDAPPLETPRETVPVDIVTDAQFSQITKGEKTAKAAKPAPPKADKAAEVEEKKPTPPVVAKADTPVPPPPLKRVADPGEDEDTPTPPRKMASLPPPTPPAPTPPAKPDVKPPTPKAEKAPEPPPKPNAEVVEPAKAPTPPTRPAEAKPRPAPKEEAKAKPLDKTALAKMLDNAKDDDVPKPTSRPKSGDESSEQKHKFDSALLAKLLSKEDPGQKPSTARSVNQTASIGAQNASAPKMSPSLADQLNELIIEQYYRCWDPSDASDDAYQPSITLQVALDGSLIGEPKWLNPTNDPVMRARGEGALRAVRKCSPLKIPAQFAQYYQDWKTLRVRFKKEGL